MSYCRGSEEWISATEIDGKAWHDSDLYLVKCNKCGKTDKCLARRPNQVILKCDEVLENAR